MRCRRRPASVFGASWAQGTRVIEGRHESRAVSPARPPLLFQLLLRGLCSLAWPAIQSWLGLASADGRHANMHTSWISSHEWPELNSNCQRATPGTKRERGRGRKLTLIGRPSELSACVHGARASDIGSRKLSARLNKSGVPAAAA